METDQCGRAALAYLVHDLDDAAVRRRVDLLSGEGFVVGLGGFCRHAGAVSGRLAEAGQTPGTDAPGRAGAPPRAQVVVNLGRTIDARLGQRAALVMRYVLSPGPLRRLCAQAPVIVARNLEMLVLAARVRGRQQRLVYECLDIHRLMLGTGRKSRLMRWIERRLLARTDLVIVSSPAFAREYFAQRQGRRDRVLLVENKVPAQPRNDRAHIEAPTVPVSTIGWFGMLRCRKTLDQLAQVARASGGRIAVVIAGIPSPAEFPDFARQVETLPGLRYLGPFRPDDLARLYGAVDFVWAVDYFEEGLNSDWLLPNRLYEGLAHGVIPIALRHVETGRWLARHGVGLLIDDPVAQLPRLLADLTPSDRQRLRASIAALPEDVLFQTRAERREIACTIAGGAVA